MSTLDRTRWRMLEPLLDRALELSPPQRDAWLEELRGRDPHTAADLRALLDDDASADRDGFLSCPLEITLEGHEIGEYSLIRPLGHGGMGSVWLARRGESDDPPVAVKLLNLSLLGGAGGGAERFRREGALLARLAHPGIARLLDAGVSRAGQPFLILEFVDGTPLDSYAESNALSRGDRLTLFVRVLEAVGHAHAHSVVHLDLKPSNILVGRDGAPKLLDFGVAKLIDGGAASPSTLTIETGAVFTPLYASPEQIAGDPITAATDVYALGVMLYLLLSAENPSRTPADARSLGDSSIDAIVGKALQEIPRDRYQTVEAFADDIGRVLRHEPVSAQRDSSNWWRRSKRAFRHDR